MPLSEVKAKAKGYFRFPGSNFKMKGFKCSLGHMVCRVYDQTSHLIDFILGHLSPP